MPKPDQPKQPKQPDKPQAPQASPVPRAKRVLFILKHPDYITDPPRSYSEEFNTGLQASARMVGEMLEKKFGYETELKYIRTNDQIINEVVTFSPKTVVIEAYWISPSTFNTLTQRFPNIRWIVRNHSATPFLALEDTIVKWSLDYMSYPNVVVACNELRTDAEFANLVSILHPNWNEKKVRERIVLLPNFYPAVLRPRTPAEQKEKNQHRVQKIWNVSCFGAIRPFKNHLMQAIAAITYAESKGLKLRFHINATEAEQDSAILKNLRALFEDLPQFKLVEHPWLSHVEFIDLCQQMDLGMQVAFSETFNISVADLVSCGIPVVVSPEITWVEPTYYADPTHHDSIVEAISKAAKTKIRPPSASLIADVDPDDTAEQVMEKIALARGEKLVKKNLARLQDYNDWSVSLWKNFLNP
jgi:hypothetical protein